MAEEGFCTLGCERKKIKGANFMKTAKRILAMLIVCLVVTVAVPTQFNDSVLTVEAHGGRTDKYGGHRDNKNVSGLGYYHYHCGGYPPHLHENGVCPYAGVSNSAAASSSDASTTVPSDTINSAASNGGSVQVTASADSTVELSVKISDTSYDTAAFNASYYASTYEDVYKAYGDDAKALFDHFISSGIIEGRQSSEKFSILAYKDNNQDLAEAFGDDLIKYYNHFNEHGVYENRIAK